MKTLLTVLAAAASVFAADMQVSVAVNGGRDIEAEPGEVWIIAASVVGPDGVANAAEQARVSIAAQEEGREIPLVSRQGTAGRVGDYTVASRVWTASPDATRDLRPGAYRIAIQVPGIEDVVVTNVMVRAAIPQDDLQHVARKRLSLSQWFELEGRAQEALDEARALADAQPENLAARVRIAELLMAAERWREALEALDAAEMLYYRLHPDQTHSPGLIRIKQREVLGRLEAGGAVTAGP